LKARQEVIKGLDGDPDFSLRYLERKRKDEFAPKQQVEHSGSIDNITPEEKTEINNRVAAWSTKPNPHGP
jgi:hypothetical protein